MQQFEPLIAGNYYHIYNRGINSCNLFKETDNYAYFLSLFDKYISPVTDTFAWILMPNHFHFLIRLKEAAESVSAPFTPDRVPNPVRGEDPNPPPTNWHFSFVKGQFGFLKGPSHIVFVVKKDPSLSGLLNDKSGNCKPLIWQMKK